MLRRLPERHKSHALHLLTGTKSSGSSFLYGKPHDMVRFIMIAPLNESSRRIILLSLSQRKKHQLGLPCQQLKDAKKWGKMMPKVSSLESVIRIEL